MTFNLDKKAIAQILYNAKVTADAGKLAEKQERKHFAVQQNKGVKNESPVEKVKDVEFSPELMQAIIAELKAQYGIDLSHLPPEHLPKNEEEWMITLASLDAEIEVAANTQESQVQTEEPKNEIEEQKDETPAEVKNETKEAVAEMSPENKEKHLEQLVIETVELIKHNPALQFAFLAGGNVLGVEKGDTVGHHPYIFNKEKQKFEMIHFGSYDYLDYSDPKNSLYQQAWYIKKLPDGITSIVCDVPMRGTKDSPYLTDMRGGTHAAFALNYKEFNLDAIENKEIVEKIKAQDIDFIDRVFQKCAKEFMPEYHNFLLTQYQKHLDMQNKNNTANEQKSETQEVKENAFDMEYSLQDIEAEVRTLLGGVLEGKPAKLTSLNIKDKGGDLVVEANLTGTGWKSALVGDPKLVAIVKNSKDSIAVDPKQIERDIQANALVKGFIPFDKLGALGDELKKYLQTKTKKSIEKIQIKDGKLAIKFAK